jgi:hypothetical protein
MGSRELNLRVSLKPRLREKIQKFQKKKLKLQFSDMVRKFRLPRWGEGSSEAQNFPLAAMSLA